MLCRHVGSRSPRRRSVTLRVGVDITSYQKLADPFHSGVNHGTFLHIAHEEGLIRNTSIHAGIRAPVLRPKGDWRNDLRCGFHTVKARDLDLIGVLGVINKLKQRVAGSKVYVSVDIDVLDPAFAPG
jgi:agmatinase